MIFTNNSTLSKIQEKIISNFYIFKITGKQTLNSRLYIILML